MLLAPGIAMDNDVKGQVRAFFSKYPLRRFDKGELLVQAEEAPAGVFYLEEGRVSQYDVAPLGSEVVVNVFKPGTFFPMSWAMNGTTNHYFFEASTTIRVRQAPPKEVVEFLQAHPDILYDLLARVYRGVDGVLRRMAHLMGGDAKSRLIFELLNAANRFGEPRSMGEVFIPLKEGDIGRHSGLARETVNRTIRQLKQTDVLTVDASGIVIKDTAQLEQLLGQSL